MSETHNSAAESNETAPPKKSKLKALLGTLAGTISAAVMAWLTPLVMNIAKPPKPVANFAVEHNGLDVTFQNRSSGATKLCWDFGDDSALEFLPSSQPQVTHTYTRTGKYHVKLTVSNILGDQNDRTVDVDLSDAKVAATSAPPGKPEILDLYPRSLSSNLGAPVYAPATFRFVASAQNAENFVWSFGDNSEPQAGSSEMVHTFATPGQYHVKLCAFNGKEVSQKDVVVPVQPPPSGSLTYTLKVVDSGTPVDVRQRTESVSQAVMIQPNKGPATIERLISATSGYEITRCDLKQNLSSNVRQVDCQIGPNRTSAKVIAYLNPVSAPGEAVLNQKVLIEEQRRGKPSVQAAPALLGTVTAPGSVDLRLPPSPANWTGLKRQLTFELAQGNTIVWRGNALPNRASINIGGFQYSLTAVVADDKVQIQIGR